MKIFRPVAVMSLLMVTMMAMAIPARPHMKGVTLPDGTTIQLEAAGDEFFHYFRTASGEIVLSERGGYYYAEIGADGCLMTSDMALGAQSRGSVADEPELESALALTIARARAIPGEPSRAFGAPTYSQKGRLPYCSFKAKGEMRIPVLLVEYADVKFSREEGWLRDHMAEKFNSDNYTYNGATGSVRRYFLDASDGQFCPTYDIYGPVTLPHDRKYYGGNVNGSDQRVGEMVDDAVTQAGSMIDYSKYDNDRDMVVDNLVVIYAGESEVDGVDDAIWPISYYLRYNFYTDPAYGRGRKVGDYYVDSYLVADELDGNSMAAIGVVAHEFSHVIGLPDLYNTSSSAYYTPQGYSVLDMGSYNNYSRTPPTYSAYERNAMGWISPGVLDGTACNLRLESIESSNNAYLIATDSDNEFFLIENRQQEGWDTYLPGHGMLVWHIDYNENVWYNNAANNTKSHQYVDILEACGTPARTTPLARFPYPGALGVTVLSDYTTPSLVSWDGKQSGITITEIAETDGVITAKVNGGDAGIESVGADRETAVTLEGRNILVTGGCGGVFDMQGRTVSGEGGRYYVETPGLYIVRGLAGVSVKVSVP